MEKKKRIRKKSLKWFTAKALLRKSVKAGRRKQPEYNKDGNKINKEGLNSYSFVFWISGCFDRKTFRLKRMKKGLKTYSFLIDKVNVLTQRVTKKIITLIGPRLQYRWV